MRASEPREGLYAGLANPRAALNKPTLLSMPMSCMICTVHMVLFSVFTYDLILPLIQLVCSFACLTWERSANEPYQRLRTWAALVGACQNAQLLQFLRPTSLTFFHYALRFPSIKLMSLCKLEQGGKWYARQ